MSRELLAWLFTTEGLWRSGKGGRGAGSREIDYIRGALSAGTGDPQDLGRLFPATSRVAVCPCGIVFDVRGPYACVKNKYGYVQVSTHTYSGKVGVVAVSWE